MTLLAKHFFLNFLLKSKAGSLNGYKVSILLLYAKYQSTFMFCTQEMNQCNYQYQIPTPDTYYKYQGNRKAYVCQKPKYDVKRKTMPRQQQLLLKCRSECSGNHEPWEDVILLDDNINIYFVISIIYRTLSIFCKV